MKENEKRERYFSIELESKSSLKNITLANTGNEKVLLEGTIGELIQADFPEGMLLEVLGKKGLLRINVKENEIACKGATAASTIVK